MSERIILVTNDDGIAAAGLQSLVKAVQEFGRPIVVAPALPHSQCSHSITTAQRLVIQRLRTDCYSVAGTPVDCVRLGITHLAQGAQWLVSGINHGANLGGDIVVSGTVAAAREASIRGLAAVAVSQYRKPEVADCWDTSSERAALVLREIFAAEVLRHCFWNVNLPAQPREESPKIRWCDVDSLPLPIHYEQHGAAFRYAINYHERPRTPGLDVALCFSGSITVSHLSGDSCNLRSPA